MSQQTIQAVYAPRAATIGTWELAGLLASGSYADLHLARPANSGPHYSSDYVVKVVREDDQREAGNARLRREAWLGRKLSHPHLISVLDAGLDADRFFLVMPRLQGASVRGVLQRVGPIAPSHALWITRQVAQALQVVHDLGWIHADINPQNIFISPEGHATLLDLGMARPYITAERCEKRYLEGTLPYLSPEAFTVHHECDPRSDLYSLGVTLYEMLTGRYPFAARGDWGTAHLTEVPIPVRRWAPHLSNAIGELLDRILAKVPLRRPQSSHELIRQIVELEIETLSG